MSSSEKEDELFLNYFKSFPKSLLKQNTMIHSFIFKLKKVTTTFNNERRPGKRTEASSHKSNLTYGDRLINKIIPMLGNGRLLPYSITGIAEAAISRIGFEPLSGSGATFGS